MERNVCFWPWIRFNIWGDVPFPTIKSNGRWSLSLPTVCILSYVQIQNGMSWLYRTTQGPTKPLHGAWSRYNHTQPCSAVGNPNCDPHPSEPASLWPLQEARTILCSKWSNAPKGDMSISPLSSYKLGNLKYEHYICLGKYIQKHGVDGFSCQQNKMAVPKL